MFLLFSEYKCEGRDFRKATTSNHEIQLISRTRVPTKGQPPQGCGFDRSPTLAL